MLTNIKMKLNAIKVNKHVLYTQLHVHTKHKICRAIKIELCAKVNAKRKASTTGINKLSPTIKGDQHNLIFAKYTYITIYICIRVYNLSFCN